MKSRILILFISLTCAMVCFVLPACGADNEDWKETDINGFYMMGGGSSASYTHWGLELHDEKINDATKTFVVSYSYDSYKGGESVSDKTFFYVSYGYYTINNIFRDTDYVEYDISLEYIVKDSNAPSWNSMTVTVTPEKVYCIYNGQRLYKQC